MALTTPAILQQYIPRQALPYCLDLWKRYPFRLHLRKKRITKVGDFCAQRNKGPVITLNHDLHPYLFLVTYIHEFSHHAVWIVYGHRPDPHGKEWKQAFQTFMGPVMELQIFPDDLQACLEAHLKNPKASSFSDPQLTALFRKYDERLRHEVLVSQVPEGSRFYLNRKLYRKGALRRTRFICYQLPGGRPYLVPGDLPVDAAEADLNPGLASG
ncbi:MAG: SprT-like domain-containing protein [Bacteroidota bacterium]